MDLAIPVDKMLCEFFAAKVAIFVKTMALQGIPGDYQDKLSSYVRSFGKLSQEIEYKYVTEGWHVKGMSFMIDNSEIFTVHFGLDERLRCNDLRVTLGKGIGVESYVYGLLISVFAQRCSGGTKQLYELGALLESVKIDFGSLKDIFDSEHETSKLIVQTQDYYGNSAELYRYAWYSDMFLLGFASAKYDLDSLYNRYIDMAYCFLSRLVGTKRAKYWDCCQKIWVTI